MGDERDKVMAFRLKQLSKEMNRKDNSQTEVPPVIVAVVGLFHQEGILEQLQKKISAEEVDQLCKIPVGAGMEKVTNQ